MRSSPSEQGAASAREKLLPKLAKLPSRLECIELNFGALLFKHALSDTEQQEIVAACLAMSKEGGLLIKKPSNEVTLTPTGNSALIPKTKYTSNEKKAIPLLFYNCAPCVR